jgi:hypothetical protein
LLAKTAASYPSQELSLETFGEFRDAWKELAALHGISAVESALRTLRLTSRFFPHPAEISEIIAAAKEKERAAQRAKRDRERLEQYERDEQHRREHPEEYESMGAIVGEFYRKCGQREASTLPANDGHFTDPHDRIMAALSRGMYAGKEYEPAIVEQVTAWRLKHPEMAAAS